MSSKEIRHVTSVHCIELLIDKDSLPPLDIPLILLCTQIFQQVIKTIIIGANVELQCFVKLRIESQIIF